VKEPTQASKSALIDKVLKEKARLLACKTMTDQAQKNVNLAIIKAIDGGVSQNELSRQWGTSPTRIRERVAAGRFLQETK
jgi:hypothetical protein